MTAIANNAAVMSSCSVIALYVETILQTYVTISYSSVSSPEAVVSLSAIGIAFLSTSIASYFLVNSSVVFGNNEDNLKTKMVFRFLHIFQVGLLWRVFKMITLFSGSDAKLLTDLRLVHVSIQSLPYTILYSSTYLIRGKITPIQLLSLVISIKSAAFAITCYNLRLKTCGENDEDETNGLNKSSNFKSTCAVVATFLGTSIVLFSRGASITLMAAQVHLWALLPLSLHFILILVVFMLFSSRSTKVTPRAWYIVKHSFYCLGMSLLNSFDLVYDNISLVMCKYVAFYSLLLIENIIFISFWLLNFDFDYVSKLVTVLGILSAFIVGLVVKFAGCTFTLYHPKHSEREEDSSHVTVDLPPVTTTVSSATLSFVNPSALDKDDDLISIVQASLAYRSQQSNNIVLQNSPSTNELLQLNVTSTPRLQKNFATHGKTSKTKEKFSIKSRKRNRKPSIASIHSPCSVHNKDNNRLSSNESPSTLPPHGTLSRSRGPSNSSITVDQNDSFQHSSVLSVSDPETLLSDMMYDEVGAELCCNIPDETLQKNIIKDGNPIKDARDKRHDLSKSQGSHEINHPERMHTIHNLNHPSFRLQHNSSIPGKSRPSTFINTTPASKLFIGKRKNDRLNVELNENQSRDFSNQNNESSDNAVSSAKTYPRHSKFDREMKNLLSSITGTEGQIQTTHTLNSSTRANRFSDSETVVKTNNKSGRLHSSNNTDRKIYTNKIITYTEPEDIDINNTLTSNTNTNTSSRNKASKPDQQARKISASSHKSPVTPRDKIQRVDYGAKSEYTVLAPRVLSANNTIQLCESGSSSFTTTVTHGNMTQSSSTTTMTTEDHWHDDRGESSDTKSDRLSQFLLQSDTEKISLSENILRWLSTTESSHKENG